VAHDVQLPDGSTVSFPDDMPDSDIANVLKAHLSPSAHAAGAFATGVNQGIAGLLGAPVDLAAAGVNAAVMPLRELQGRLDAALPPSMQRYVSPPSSGQIAAPFGGSQSIQQGISGAVGETPPVGNVERYLQAGGRGAGATAAGMLTGGALNAAQAFPMLSSALGGGADTLRAALTNLFAGGAAGVGQRGGQELASQYTDSPAAQELAGLVGGAGLGAAVGYAPTAAGSLYTKYLAPAGTKAEAAIRNAFTQGTKAGAPDYQATQEFINQPDTVAAGLTPKPVAMADVQNEPLRALAERVAQMPGPGAQTARDFLQQRDVASGSRLVNDLQENIVAGPSAYQSGKRIADMQARQSAPLYDAAFNHPQNQAIADPAIDDVLATPAGQSAFSQARVKMANDGIPVGATSPTDLRTLDYTKRALDDQIGAALRSGARDDARILIGMKNRLVGALDNADASGAYSQARSTFAGHAQAQTAIDEGAAIFKKNPEFIADEVAALSPADKPLYLTGARDALAQRIAQTSSGGNEALKIVGNDQIQNQLRPLFDTDKQFNAFINQAKLESLMYGTRLRDIGGSQTFQRLAGAAEGPLAGVAGHLLTAGGAALTSEPIVSVSSAARGITKMISAATGLTQPVRAEIANRLFSSDPATLQSMLGTLAPATAGAPFTLAPPLIAGYPLLQGERGR